MKPFDDQRLGGDDQLLGVGIEQFAVADHLDLDPVGVERFARELGGEDGVLGGLAAGGVGQEMRTARGSRSTRLSSSPARLMRRIEAVTISVPLAATASSITWRFG